MKKNLFLLFTLIGCCALTALCAGNGVTEEEEIKMVIGETYSQPADTPTQVGVADPKVADVVLAATKNIILIGKGKGRTNFSYIDRLGEHQLKILVVPEDINYLVEHIKSTIKDINLKQVYTTPVENQGKVMLLGTVRNVQEKERLKTALGDLAPKTIDMVQIEEAALVEIAVEVFEINKGSTKELGFTVPRTVSVDEAAVPAASTTWKEFFKIGALNRGETLSWKLDMLEDEGKAQLLARPRVVCQSGKEADMTIGGEVPVFNTSISSLGGQSTSVEYKSYGIKLKINPVVTEDKRIQLGLNFEVSELGEADIIGAANAPTAKAYPLQTRTIKTDLHLQDGDTLAIGGLIKRKTSEDIAKFPWLADVPVFGAFFRHKTVTTGAGAGKDDTEVFMTITPKIIYAAAPKNPQDDVIQVKQKEFVSAYARTDIPAPLQDYVLDIQKRIMSNIAYPASLVGTGWEGKVLLKILIERAGALKEVQILSSSGYKIFDEEALKLVKNITYPPFNFDSSLEELKVEVPLVYREKK